MAFWDVPAKVRDLEIYQETVALADFTDGEGTSGTYTCTFELPAGFWINRAILTDVTGFAGDTSAVAIIGDGTDTDRLNTGTPSVFTTATIIDLGAPSGVLPVTTAFKPVITITSAADFGDVSAGKLTLQVWGYKVR